jgi:hypothetical protein
LVSTSFALALVQMRIWKSPTVEGGREGGRERDKERKRVSECERDECTLFEGYGSPDKKK